MSSCMDNDFERFVAQLGTLENSMTLPVLFHATYFIYTFRSPFLHFIIKSKTLLNCVLLIISANIDWDTINTEEQYEIKMLYFKPSYCTFCMDITTFVVKIEKLVKSLKVFHSTMVIQSYFIFLIKTNVFTFE